MSQDNFLLSVYNTITGTTEDVEVSEAVYNGYRRGGWSVDYNDQRFHNHETAFSELKGGLDGAYENFDEFRSEQDNPERLVIEKLTSQQLLTALDLLDETERSLLRLLFVDGKSVREAAAICGVSHNAVHKKKQRLQKFLQKFLE